MTHKCWIVSTLTTLFLVVAHFAPSLVWLAAAQTARIEIHSFETQTLSDQQFLTGAKDGKSVIIGGELRLPPGTGRGIVSTTTDQSQLGRLNMIVDAFRALAVLSKHARIDVSRIALMGFSRGGQATLHASLKRFHRLHAPTGVEFAAYIPFYATCNTIFIEDDQLVDRPIRLFHGTADDYVPIEPCRQYVKRLQSLQKDIQLTEYEGARHSFDNPLGPPVRELPDAQNWTHCALEERPGGQIVNRETNQPFSYNDPCVQRGATTGYDANATAEATKAVKEFLVSRWKLNAP